MNAISAKGRRAARDRAGRVGCPHQACGLLSHGRQARDGRPDLQSHLLARSRPRGSVPHQSLRVAVRRDHGVEPGEDRHQGQQARRHAAGRQRRGLRHPCRDPHLEPRRGLRAAYPFRCERRGVRTGEGPAAAQPVRDALLRPSGLPRLRRRRHRPRRAGAPGARSRPAQGDADAQPRHPHRRPDAGRGLHAAVLFRARRADPAPDAGRGRSPAPSW